jgi:hypothetical protein
MAIVCGRTRHGHCSQPRSAHAQPKGISAPTSVVRGHHFVADQDTDVAKELIARASSAWLARLPSVRNTAHTALLPLGAFRIRLDASVETSRHPIVNKDRTSPEPRAVAPLQRVPGMLGADERENWPLVEGAVNQRDRRSGWNIAKAFCFVLNAGESRDPGRKFHNRAPRRR